MEPRSARPPATYADLERLPDEVTGEIVGGELFVSPRPAPAHTVAHSVLVAALGSAFSLGKPGRGAGWWILLEPELHLGPDVLVPDIAGWRRDRLPVMPRTAFFEVPPDFVCEIASPATARVDVVYKLPRYAAVGVGHAWVVDPLRRILEAYRRLDDKWLRIAGHGGDDRARVEPFEELELDLSLLWAPETPSVHGPVEKYKP